MNLRGLKISVASATAEWNRHDKAFDQAVVQLEKIKAELADIEAAISAGAAGAVALMAKAARLNSKRVKTTEVMLLRQEVLEHAFSLLCKIKAEEGESGG
jgi:ABC-type transporter Mla subunit MlaD